MPLCLILSTSITVQCLTSPTSSQYHIQHIIFSIHHHHHNHLRLFFQDHPGEPVPEENFWTMCLQGKINRGRHTNRPAGRHSIRTKQCPPPSSPCFSQAGCSSCRPTNSVKALKATSILHYSKTDQ